MAEEQKSLGEVAYTALRPYTEYQHWTPWEATVPHQRQLYEAMAQAVKAAVLAESARLGAHSGAHRQKMVEHGVRECREAQADLQRALVYLAAAMSGPPEEAPGD